MSYSATRPIPTPDLVARLVAAERQCMTDWLQALADLPGNPFGIVIQTFGQATALLCRFVYHSNPQCTNMPLLDFRHMPRASQAGDAQLT